MARMGWRAILPALALAAVLAGCAAGKPADDSNPACAKKWETVVSLVRCSFDIEPPPEPAVRAPDTIGAPTRDSGYSDG